LLGTWHSAGSQPPVSTKAKLSSSEVLGYQRPWSASCLVAWGETVTTITAANTKARTQRS